MRRRSGPAPRPPATPLRLDSIETLTITALGAQGDGIAHGTDGTARFIAGALPGESVTATPLTGNRATLETILTASPDRVTPPCPVFGTCGGCSLQHWRDGAALAWKAGRVRESLARAGFAIPETVSIVPCPAASRRRADFALLRPPGVAKAGIVLGLHEPGRKTIVPLTSCPALVPPLSALIESLRAMLGGLQAFRREGSAVLNLLDSGPDLLLRTDAPLTPPDRAALTGFARANALPRIAHATLRGAPETVCELGPPLIALGTLTLRPAPGAFLQASREGEAAIRAAIAEALPALRTNRKHPRIVELYAGIGSFTGALAAHGGVTAYEGNAEAAAALRHASGGHGIAVVTRDLVRQPVPASDLKKAEIVVLDPPFDGAGPQLAEIAASGIRHVIYISCNPAALGQEAKLLCAAGYTLARLALIDQFVWTTGIETVAVFSKGQR